MSHRVETIKRRLKRYHAWAPNYLDEMVDNATRIIMNDLSNKGPRAQCEFLLEHGWSVDSIVSHGKSVSRRIRRYLVGIHEHKHKHKEKRK